MLDLKDFNPGSSDEFLSEAASELLLGNCLNVNGKAFEIIEIEFYIHQKGVHEDKSVFRRDCPAGFFFFINTVLIFHFFLHQRWASTGYPCALVEE
ncbi:MAG: hypothetical protein ACLFQK_05310 [Fibrobacterota bacterium]